MTNLPATNEAADTEVKTGGAGVGLAAADALTLARAHEDDFEWEPPWKGLFLRNLRLMPNITAAARLAGQTRQNVFYHRGTDPLFAVVWDDAIQVATDSLERFAHTLATTGMETHETRRTIKRELQTNAAGQTELVVVEDTTVEVEGRLVDPAMTRWLLRAHRPDKYTPDQKHVHSAPGGGPVQVEVHRHPDPERVLELARIAVELGPDDIEHGEAIEVNEEEPPEV